jgi:hypothetical protein
MSLIKILNIFLCVIILTLLPFGFNSYEGNKIYYLIFTLISSYALLISFQKRSSSFESFFSLLIWLGFWFKFTVQISFLNSLFPEGSGLFDYKPSSYDDVLVISSVSIVAFIAARYFRLKFIFDYTNISIYKINYNNYLSFYSNNRKIIHWIYFFSIVFFPFLNFIFVYFQKGTIPETILPLGLNHIINWLLMFGLTSFSTIIIFFEFKLKNDDSNKMIKYGFLETFNSSISILSRAMIFNSTALIYGLYRLTEIKNIKVKKNIFIRYFMIVLLLFMTSLLIVSKLRQSNDFPIGHEVHAYIPMINIDNDEMVNEVVNDLSKELNQILFLLAGRWVGVEGVMAVSGKNDLNFNSFFESFKDEFNYSNSFYENKIKGSKYIYSSKPKIYTVYVPGIVAFLFYTKSLIFLFFGIFLLCIFCSIIEFFAYKLSSGNIVFSYLIGNILAYRLAHFGYLPQNSYKLILAIIFNIFLVYFFMKLAKSYNK